MHPVRYPGYMVIPGDGPFGLISDSHGNLAALLDAILMLEQMGMRTLVHLGDICDSLAPHTLEDAVKILRDHGVRTVRGNNEHAVLSDHQARDRGVLSPDVVAYLAGLPYTLTMGDFSFAHSAPFEWPAATRRPFAEYLPRFLERGPLPFRILFSGHSHSPSILEINGHRLKKIPAREGITQRLSRDRHYVITVGAVQEGSCAVFLPEEYAIQFLQLNGR